MSKVAQTPHGAFDCYGAIECRWAASPPGADAPASVPGAFTPPRSIPSLRPGSSRNDQISAIIIEIRVAGTCQCLAEFQLLDVGKMGAAPLQAADRPPTQPHNAGAPLARVTLSRHPRADKGQNLLCPLDT